MLNIMVQAQSMCNDQLDTHHWFYKWMHAGEDRDDQKILNTPPNDLFPSELTISRDRIDTSRLDENDYQHELVVKLQLNEFGFALEILGEEPIYTDTLEMVRLTETDAWNRVWETHSVTYLWR